MIEALHANAFEDLYSIHETKFNIGLMNIDDLEPTGIKNYLEKNFHKLPRMFKCIVSKDNFEESINQLDEIYYVLDDNEEKTELINFVKTLASNFADITDSPDMGISLEKVEGDLCKYFHCDMNHLRLVYPLLGPGTLYLNEDNVERRFLGKGSNENVVKDPTKINQVPPKTISLLKGQGHPSAHGLAIVHASPPINRMVDKRVLLRIESIF